MNAESQLIGESPAIKRLRKELPQLAKLQRPLLIKGDLGVGKALVAKLIWESSAPRGGFLLVNPLTATDDDLKLALGGGNSEISCVTFRDIEEFSFLHQMQIDRYLEKLPQKPPVQMIVTARQPLTESRKEGMMTGDLYDLLKGYENITVPPLSQRQSDIPLLVDYFIRNACEATGAAVKSMDANALDFIIRREWKGNVRELKAVIEKAVFTSEGDTVDLPDDLIDEFCQLDGIIDSIKLRKAFSFDKSLYNLEKTLIERTLDIVGYNQSRAAEMLRLSEANLRYRLKKFHIPTSQEKKGRH